MGKKLTTEQFIEKARLVHGDKYDYSKVEYVDAHTKVCIICREHGEFWQIANDHLCGKGCNKCGVIATHNTQRKDKDTFILKANRIHNSKYDYSLFDYKSAHHKSKIICPIHGVFEQSADSHIHGHGCSKCRDESRKHLVYGIGINDCLGAVHEGHIYKIWCDMLSRSNCKRLKQKHPTYADCKCCEEWVYYSNFKKWFYTQNYKEGYHLDKDILVQGNKIYGPDTCCFVPPYINSLLVYQKKKDGELKRGVSKGINEKKYRATCSIHKRTIHLGSFNTEDEAHEAYKEAKYAEIKRVAKEALEKGDIDERIYNALLKYEIKEY